MRVYQIELTADFNGMKRGRFFNDVTETGDGYLVHWPGALIIPKSAAKVTAYTVSGDEQVSNDNIGLAARERDDATTRTKTGRRISKTEFERIGGLSNPKAFRKQTGKSWSYWISQ